MPNGGVNMSQGFFITGTDTDVGKTVASAWAMLHLEADYWKPVQCGFDPSTDIKSVQAMTGLPAERFHAECYRLGAPLSPHEAAKREGVQIDMMAFTLPKTDRPLIVEGAGGLMVPLNKNFFVVDLITHLNLSAILVCRSGLGTINHTLLSLEALAARGITVEGIIMSGEKSPHNREALEEYGHIPILAELDHMDVINEEALLNIKPEFALMDKKRNAA